MAHVVTVKQEGQNYVARCSCGDKWVHRDDRELITIRANDHADKSNDIEEVID